MKTESDERKIHHVVIEQVHEKRQFSKNLDDSGEWKGMNVMVREHERKPFVQTPVTHHPEQHQRIRPSKHGHAVIEQKGAVSGHSLIRPVDYLSAQSSPAGAGALLCASA